VSSHLPTGRCSVPQATARRPSAALRAEIEIRHGAVTGNVDEIIVASTAIGAGLDFALTRNFFVRAEYEYVYFSPVAGLRLDINTVRVGAGIKF
jgi:opacity protein-like surface antigen